MINENYAKAYTEVLEIIKYFPDDELKKIPKEKIDFFKENMDKDYKFIIDPQIDLSKQNISKEANSIIIVLYQEYFATEAQKVKINKILELNQIKKEQEKIEKYNPDNLFKSSNDTNNKESKNTDINSVMSLTEYKDSFFSRFKKFILKIFHLD